MLSYNYNILLVRKIGEREEYMNLFDDMVYIYIIN